MSFKSVSQKYQKQFFCDVFRVYIHPVYVEVRPEHTADH